MYKLIFSEAGTNIELPPRTDFPQFANDKPDMIEQEGSREKAHQLVDLFFDDLDLQVMETEEKQDAA